MLKGKITKILIINLTIILVLCFKIWGVESLTNIKNTDKKIQIAVLDVISSSLDKNKIVFLTDSFQTELYKTKIFSILERGVIQQAIMELKFQMSGLISDSEIVKIGKFLSVQKLFVCKIEKFGDSIAINIRIIDVETLLIDYTENVYVRDESMIIDAIKEIVSKVSYFYTIEKQKDNLEGIRDANFNIKKWRIIGASDEDLSFLITNKCDPDEYLNIRQYDISFTIKDYIEVKKNFKDTSIILNFLQKGISYELAKKSINLGIEKIDYYLTVFKPRNISFNDYLFAYQNKVTSIEDYDKFKAAYKRDRIILGLGGVSDKTPIATAIHRFFIGQIGLEHFWTEFQRGYFKWSIQPGIYLLNLYAPIPQFNINSYFGVYPIYFKLGIGGFYEILIGGHYAGILNIGFEVNETYEVNISCIYGNQPEVSYANFVTRKGEQGYDEIQMPYFGIIFCYKY